MTRFVGFLLRSLVCLTLLVPAGMCQALGLDCCAAHKIAARSTIPTARGCTRCCAARPSAEAAGATTSVPGSCLQHCCQKHERVPAPSGPALLSTPPVAWIVPASPVLSQVVVPTELAAAPPLYLLHCVWRC